MRGTGTSVSTMTSACPYGRSSLLHAHGRPKRSAAPAHARLQRLQLTTPIFAQPNDERATPVVVHHPDRRYAPGMAIRSSRVARASLVALSFDLWLVACVGDEPIASGTSGDSGVDVAQGDTAPPDGSNPDGPAADEAGRDASICDPAKPFPAPSMVPGISTTDAGAIENTWAALAAGGRQIVFASNRRSGTVNYDLFFAQRADPSAAFDGITPLSALDGDGDERGPAFGADGVTLYYYSNVTGTYDIYTSTRANTASSTFAAGNPLSAVNTPDSEFDPQPTADGAALYFTRIPAAGGPARIYRALASAGFASASPITELDSTHGSVGPVPTAGDLGLYFSKVDPSGDTLWFASRASRTSPYTTFRAVAELGVGVRASWLSPDGCTLYFWTSNSQTVPNAQLYVTTKSP